MEPTERQRVENLERFTKALLKVIGVEDNVIHVEDKDLPSKYVENSIILINYSYLQIEVSGVALEPTY